MRNQRAAVAARLSDPDFQGKLVNRCIGLTIAMAAVLCLSIAVHAYEWSHPVPPRYFFTDGKHAPRPVVALDSPIVDDPELLDWTVKAVLAPYNIDYFNYPRGAEHGQPAVHAARLEHLCPVVHRPGKLRGAEARAPALPRPVAARGGDPPDELRGGQARPTKSSFR